MGRLIYSTNASLDGYIEDAQGEFHWSRPDEEVFGFITNLQRSVGTCLYGRRMYETMVYWETVPLDEETPQSFRDFTRMWRAAEKVVYSRTLKSWSSAKTRVERSFDSEAVARLKRATTADLSVAGAELAGQALEASLVDELQLFVVPVIVGGGKSWLPKGVLVNLELLESHRFSSGVVFLRYRPRDPKDLEANTRAGEELPAKPHAHDAGD